MPKVKFGFPKGRWTCKKCGDTNGRIFTYCESCQMKRDLENAVAYGKTIDTFMDSIFNQKKEKSHEA